MFAPSTSYAGTVLPACPAHLQSRGVQARQHVSSQSRPALSLSSLEPFSSRPLSNSFASTRFRHPIHVRAAVAIKEEQHSAQPAAAEQSGGQPKGGKGKGKGGKGGRGKSGGGGEGATRAAASTVSSGVKLEDIRITFKNQELLKGVSWEVKKGERVGLVGVNGAGKTTQLQIITGALQPDSGAVVKEKPNMRIAYLTQEFDVEPTRTVREEFMSAYAEQMALMNRQEEIQKGLEECGEDMDRMSALLDELQELSGQAAELDIKLLDKKVDQMMPELGFTSDDNDRLVASYSGGWQMRMCLGKILLQEPDLLLLDEPTNHLDLDALEWLEGYLLKQDIPLVIVSHDREFLDQLCTKIVETEHGKATTYKGNYTQYVAAKAEKVALQWAAYEKQQKEIARQTDIIARLTGGDQAGRAAAAKKALEKIKSEEGIVTKPFVPKKRSFAFPTPERMGQRVLEINGLTHGYGDRLLFDKVDLEIEKGERVAIIGPNGCGKSTLLRLIMGIEKPISGSVGLGQYHILPNYFEQNQAEALDLELSVQETLERSATEAQLNDIKALLGRMMFTGKSVHKKVRVLSGGEKARLALAKFMLTPGTLLVLDEPTNHLDIPSKEMLEEALVSFPGAVISVSHDRYFLRKIATRIIAVESCSLRDYEGNYDRFLEKNEGEAEVMAEKEAKKRELEKSQIKAKSKVSKAEKIMQKKAKAKEFNTKKSVGKEAKNAKRWN
ncbi:probable energy-dependent translational throttle protein EttA [Coccomyxa sp. Obi]|nr:probable energy-dependent translational throttle protein EttA [Coccomyxa sp. Obi]